MNKQEYKQELIKLYGILENNDNTLEIFKRKNEKLLDMNKKKKIKQYICEKGNEKNIPIFEEYEKIFNERKNLKKSNIVKNQKKEKNSSKTGKNRDLKDQFYTIPSVAEQCIKNFENNIKINENDLIIEPSAGDGSFSNSLLKKYKNIETYDIEPKKDYIIKQDFLKLDTKKYMDYEKIHAIGNPPFGRQSSLAKKFINKCCLFCDTISFILPKSFRKSSYQKSFLLNFHLIKEYEIEKNAFTINNEIHNVPCVFQIWEKKDIKRDVEEKQIEEGFKFISKPLIEILEVNEKGKQIRKKNIFSENPDFGILRAGGGKKCGRISLNYEDGIKCYPEGWLFIKLNHGFDKDKFYNEYQKIDWSDNSNVGARSISKPTFINKINELIKSID